MVDETGNFWVDEAGAYMAPDAQPENAMTDETGALWADETGNIMVAQ